jgi:hypothetical protein
LFNSDRRWHSQKKASRHESFAMPEGVDREMAIRLRNAAALD